VVFFIMYSVTLITVIMWCLRTMYNPKVTNEDDVRGRKACARKQRCYADGS